VQNIFHLYQLCFHAFGTSSEGQAKRTAKDLCPMLLYCNSKYIYGSAHELRIFLRAVVAETVKCTVVGFLAALNGNGTSNKISTSMSKDTLSRLMEGFCAYC
jgi:hypothetical protein